jgi:predicted  nucleic acid-binding Zn-ribbon protein
MRLLLRSKLIHLSIAASFLLIVGCSGSHQSCDTSCSTGASVENVEAQRFDGGKMWTFDYPPKDYWQEAYNFTPTDQWMEEVRLSALRFATYCSASFVSGDGLVMTNHHCGREGVESVSQEGESLTNTGFVAMTLEQERRVEGLFVEQLVEIRDVTAEIQAVMEAAKTDEEQLEARSAKREELKETMEKETGNRVQIVTFYNGGKYSAYVYKRYDDVRLVFSPELELGFFGGDPDNFTYPRYTLDANFFRVYDEDGKPLNTEHYFKWSENGAAEGEPTFVIGNPGSTSRLNTTAQLEYLRDMQYPYISRILDDAVYSLRKMIELNPETKEESINQIFSLANSQKAYKGQLEGLQNPTLMARRRDFDNKFHAAVAKSPKLAAKYGHIWDEISSDRAKVRAVAPDFFGFRANGIGVSASYGKAFGLVQVAMEMSKPEDDRAEQYQGKKGEMMLKSLAKYRAIDEVKESMDLLNQLELIQDMLGDSDPFVKQALKGQTPEVATPRLMAESVLADSAAYVNLVKAGAEAILASDDPFIQMAKIAIPRRKHAQEVLQSVSARDAVNNQLLGRALFEVYGTAIPPDATFTLRIADGVVKGYDYNGTVAPPNTTFYGMYDRHYSFKDQDEWKLPTVWLNPPAEFDMATPMNFVSTNDIIGGNSGSPMINKNREVVGLVFDGNIESLPGEFIFAEDMGNRTVSVHSSAMLQAIKFIYKVERLAYELENGKMPQ